MGSIINEFGAFDDRVKLGADTRPGDYLSTTYGNSYYNRRVGNASASIIAANKQQRLGLA